MGVSIRVVLIVMMVFLAVVSCTIIGVLIAQAGVESANQGASLLRQETVSRKQLEIGGYFFQPLSVIRSLHAASKIPGTFDIYQWDNFHLWLCSMTRLNDGRITYVGTEVGYLSAAQLKPDGITCMVEQYDAPSKATPPNGTIRVQEYRYTPRGTPFMSQHWSVQGASPSSYDPRVRPWYNLTKQTMAWSSVYLNWKPKVAAVTPTAPLVDPVLDRNVGVFASDFTTEYLLEYLSNSVVAKSGKMILVETASRNVLGATWNESAVLVETRDDCGDFKNETCEVHTMATLNDFKESMIKSAVDALGVDYLYQCNDERNASKAVACQTTYGSGRNRVFVDIAGIEDQYGLNLRLIVMIPERDFLEEVWRRSDLAAIIASVVVAVLITLSVTVVYFVLKPLKRVEERLYEAATLHSHEEEEEEQSFFTEVANIQEAYSKMAANLARIRSYVPQSLLRTLDGVDDEDEEDGDDSIVTSRSHSHGRSSSGIKSKRSHSRDSSIDSRSTAIGAVVASRSLLSATGLNARRVTVLAINLSNFHKDAHQQTVTQLVDSHAATLTTIQAIITANKGILDAFSGDHFTVSFNAVTNVASHVTRAASCIMQIGAKVHSANFGAATGSVLCGNMGNSEVKRFSMISPVVNHAYALERLCKVNDVTSLVTYACFETMQYEYHLETIDVVQLPFTPAPTPILRVVAPKEAGEDEWMYTLQDSEGTSGFTELNEAFAKYVRGETEEATAIVKTLNDDLIGTMNLKKMIKVPAAEWAKRLGLFYDVAFHGSGAEH